MSGARLELRAWGWRHAGRDSWAVQDLDLTIEPGERVLLLGPSGVGKSTVLAGLAGILGSDEDGDAAGQALIDGLPAAQSRGRCGLVLQDPDAQTILARVGDDIAFGPENLAVPRDEIWRRVDEAKQVVGLGALPNDHPTTELSGGQRQRLALAGVLAMHPDAVLLDEPTANLDPDGVTEVIDAVARAVEGRTLVLIEHKTTQWRPLIDRVIVFEGGPGGARIALDGPPDDPAIRAALDARAHPPVPARARPPLSDEPPALVASGLSVGWRRTTPVLTGIDLSVRPGECLAILGPNGAGKSTLAATLAGLLPPVRGTVTPDAYRMKARTLIGTIGMVFQVPEHQFVERTVRGELEVGPRMQGKSDADVRAIADDMLQRMRLEHLARASPYRLSGGEQRRLSVATTLAARPRIIVLDEPTFGQDPEGWSAIVGLCFELLDGTYGVRHAIVAVTHDRAFVDAVADRTLGVGPA